jgi:hypothetical protein
MLLSSFVRCRLKQWKTVPKARFPIPCEDVDLQTARPGDGVQAAFSSMVR